MHFGNVFKLTVNVIVLLYDAVLLEVARKGLTPARTQDLLLTGGSGLCLVDVKCRDRDPGVANEEEIHLEIVLLLSEFTIVC